MTSDPAHVLEALLFMSREPLAPDLVLKVLPKGTDLDALLDRLRADYEGRGLVVSVTRAGIGIRTAPAASDLAAAVVEPAQRLSRPAIETLACIAAFEQAGNPLTKSEIERVRGVGLSPGIMDALLQAGYVKPGRRRETRGQPLTWLATDHFHDAFGLAGLDDLAAYRDMAEAGLAKLHPIDAAMAEADAEGGDAEDGGSPVP